MEQDEKSFGPCKAGFARCEELLPTLPEGSEVRNAIAALLSEYHHTVEEERKVRELVREVERGSDRTIYTQRARITELEALLAEAREVVEPLAEAGRIKLCGEWRDDQSVQGTDTAFFVKFGDLRRAAALSTKLEAQG